MRKLIILFLCCLTLMLTGYVGYRAYRVGKRNHLLSMAHQFIAKSDFPNAILSINQVLLSAPNNLEALRMKADIAEAARSPAALLLRNQIVDLQPHVTSNRLALVRTALLMRDLAAATNALAGIAPADQKSADYHSLAGTVAVAAGDLAKAAQQFSEASHLEPQNPGPRLNLAVVHLHSTNQEEVALARTSLRDLSVDSTNAALRCQALRELTKDALQTGEKQTALATSEKLSSQTNSVFSDRLLRLDVLKSTQQSNFLSSLSACQTRALTNPATLYEMATWQLRNYPPAATLKWLQTLAPDQQTNQPATLLVAECYLLDRQWKPLHTWLTGQSWDDLEFMRHAFDSRALREQGLEDSSKVEWGRALETASLQKPRLAALFRLAAGWNWLSEGEELLWIVVKNYPNEQWARRILTQRLYQGGRTRSLMQLFSQEVSGPTSDPSARNNLAMTALLLGAQEMKPYELAQNVYTESPDNGAYASTYAFSLHLRDKNQEALKVMQKLKPKQLEDPSIAGYYGIILKATGRNDLAKSYLGWAFKGPLLPEERKLFENALAGL